MKKKRITYKKDRLTRAENLHGKVIFPKKDLKDSNIEIEIKSNNYWTIRSKK